MSCAKTAEPIEMSLAMWPRVADRKHVLDRGSAPNMGMFLIWAPLIYVPYVTYAKEVRRVFCAAAMPKSSEHILTSI